MKSILAILEARMPCPVYVCRTADAGECVVAEFHTVSLNGARRQVRLKTCIFASDLERALKLQGMMDAALVPKGELPLTATVTGCRQSGGGWVRDGNRHCRMAYYDITLRC